MTNKMIRFIDRFLGIPLCLKFGLLARIFPGKTTRNTDFKRILVIKLGMMGDTILMLPALRALRERFPSSGITMLCTSVNRGIVEDWGCIDGFITFDFKKTFKNPLLLLSLLRRLRKQRYDLVIDFEEWVRATALFSYFTGAKTRVGFETAGQFRHYVYSDPIPHRKAAHEIDCFCDLVEHVGAVAVDRNPGLAVKEGSKKIIQQILVEGGFAPDEKFIVIHPGCGAGGTLREWGADRYAKVADYISEKYGLRAVITGSKSEIPTAKKVFERAKRSLVNLAGKTELKELFALIEKAELVVCGNTGIMHAAAALGRPLIAIHGPTDPKRWGPKNRNSEVIRKDMDCSPCLYLGFEYGCTKKTCLNEVSEQMVFETVDRFLGGL